MTGTLNITSIPDGAKIYLDSTDTLYITPYTFTSLNAGTHSFRLSLNSYLDVNGTVEITDNQQTYLPIVMTDDFYNKLIILTMLSLGVSVIALMLRKK